MTNTIGPTQTRDPGFFKLLGIFTGLLVAALVVATVASSKILMVGPLNLPGGVLIFPITYILNDILTETYGYARSRQAVWTALACQALTGLILWLVGVLPPAAFWHNQSAYEAVLGFVPRVALAGLAAFFTGEMANSFVLSKMKYWHQGKRGLRQGWRFVASTMVGEAIDSFVVMTVAFWGVIPTVDLFTTMVTLYVVKVLYEIVSLPFSVPFSNWVKRIEHFDRIDTPDTTNYNPFLFEPGDIPVDANPARSVDQ